MSDDSAGKDSSQGGLRVPPHSIEAESSVLGGLLLDNAAWDVVSRMLVAEDFYRHEHRLIFKATEILLEQRKPADVITVYEHLLASELAAEVGGLAYLNALAQYVPSVANIRRYAEIVLERSAARRRLAAESELKVIYTPADVPIAESAAREQLVVVSESRWDDLLGALKRNPRLMHELEPRAFEELVAELLSREGLNVTLTPRTRDGGRDIFAFADTAVGRHLYYVECKRYAPTRPVDVSLVRQLYGVIEADRATAGLLVTTSRFTADAKAFGKSVSSRISLKEFDDVSSWVARNSR